MILRRNTREQFLNFSTIQLIFYILSSVYSTVEECSIDILKQTNETN